MQVSQAQMIIQAATVVVKFDDNSYQYRSGKIIYTYWPVTEYKVQLEVLYI